MAKKSVWAVVLGYNRAEDSIECLRTLAASDLPGLRLLYTDNGSGEAEARLVMEAVPEAAVLRFPENVGVGRGFNGGLAYALSQGADYLLMINNDTKVAPDAVRRLVAVLDGDPEVGIAVPKIYYYDHPETIWSAGSRYRAFPPVVIMQKTSGPDDGRYDGNLDLDFTTFCAVMFRRELLEKAGLLDTDFHFYAEDYDLSLRARKLGYGIRLEPMAHIWHKVSKSIRAGSKNPAFWETYGRSEALFCRKHRGYRLLTSWIHWVYLVARMVAEGKAYGVKPFLAGRRKGMAAELHEPPRWPNGVKDKPLVWREVVR